MEQTRFLNTAFTEATTDPVHVKAVDDCTNAILQAELAGVISAPPAAQDVDSAACARVYSPTLPTLAIDARHDFPGSVLVALANSQQETRRFNILFVSVATAGIEVVEQGNVHYLTAQRAHAVDDSGQVICIGSPDSIKIDAFDTHDEELLERLNQHGIHTLSDPAFVELANDKIQLQTFRDTTGIVTPTRVDPEMLTAQSDVVIKPAQNARGNGVYFSSTHGTDPEDWKAYHQFLDHHEYKPIIEERVRTWPIYDPKSDEQLDWNVRAIVSHGELIDMYVRIGPQGTAINKSLGAQAISMSRFSRYLDPAIDPPAGMFKGILERAAQDFAAVHPSFLVGLDLTIDDRGQVVLFEANAGNPGGILTMANLAKYGGKPARIKNAVKLLRLLETRISRVDDSNDNYTQQPLTVSLQAIEDFSSIIGDPKLLHVEMARRQDDPMSIRAASRFVINACNGLKLLNDDDEWMPKIGEMISALPLELYDHVDQLDHRILSSSTVAGHVERWLTLDPNSRNWQLLQGYLAANRLDLEPFLAVARQAKSERLVDEVVNLQAHARSALLKRLDRTTEFQALVSEDQGLIIELSIELLLKTLIDDPSEANWVGFDALCQACIDNAGNPSCLQETMLAAVVLIQIGLGKYKSATGFADQIDSNDDETSDYWLKFYSGNSDLLLRSDEGKAFFIEESLRFDTGSGVLMALLEQNGQLQLTNEMITTLANTYRSKYPDQDVRYFKSIVHAISNADHEVAQPDTDAALQLLSYLAYLRSNDKERGKTTEILTRLKSLDSQLIEEAIFITESWRASKRPR